ncbi:MAG: AraC family transcriptional regulator [Lachnospiraceae bacterium]|nr:AraC family transcriptional regulator [Lachnospiraceae bacterium]
MIVLPTESFQKYVEHPLVRRLYLTDVGYFPTAKHHYRERKSGIEEYIFFYCMEGSGTIEIGSEKYELHENDAFCIPRCAPHCYYAHPEDPWSILWVHFKGTDTGYYPLNMREIIHFSGESAANHMRFLFDLLFHVLDGNYTLGNFSYITQVLSLILAETYGREKTGSAYEQNRLVSDIIRYMQSHISESLTLDAISREFDLSPSYLNALFQKYTQHAPMNFFISLKMKQACKLLRSTNQHIYEIAYELVY